MEQGRPGRTLGRTYMKRIEMSPKTHKTLADGFNRKMHGQTGLLPSNPPTVNPLFSVFQPEAHLHTFQAWWRWDSTLVPLGGPGSAPRTPAPGGTHSAASLFHTFHPCVSPWAKKTSLLGTQKLAPQLLPSHAAPPLLVRSGRDLGESCLILFWEKEARQVLGSPSQ